MERDITTDKSWLYQKIRDNKVLWLELEFRSDFIEKMYIEYRYIEFSSLLGIINPQT